MLIEAIHYLTTPASRAQRRLGYLSESVRLLSRSRRCRLAWADHLAAARSAIMQSCADLVRRRTAVILGSGLLDDVPLSYLAERFERVILVDMIHPWPARWMARRHANVSLQIVDLSGCANWLRGEGERHADPLAVFNSDDVDLVVSANLLSQLPILPVDWFESRGIPLPPWVGSRDRRHASPGFGGSAGTCLPHHRYRGADRRPRRPRHRAVRSSPRRRFTAFRSFLDLGDSAIRRDWTPPQAAPSRPCLLRLAWMKEQQDFCLRQEKSRPT